MIIYIEKNAVCAVVWMKFQMMFQTCVVCTVSWWHHFQRLWARMQMSEIAQCHRGHCMYWCCVIRVLRVKQLKIFLPFYLLIICVFWY